MTTNNCVGDYKSSKLSDNLNKIVCCECFKEYERVEIFLCHWQNYHQNLCFPSAYTKTNVNVSLFSIDFYFLVFCLENQILNYSWIEPNILNSKIFS